MVAMLMVKACITAQTRRVESVSGSQDAVCTGTDEHSQEMI